MKLILQPCLFLTFSALHFSFRPWKPPFFAGFSLGIAKIIFLSNEKQPGVLSLPPQYIVVSPYSVRPLSYSHSSLFTESKNISCRSDLQDVELIFMYIYSSLRSSPCISPSYCQLSLVPNTFHFNPH